MSSSISFSQMGAISAIKSLKEFADKQDENAVVRFAVSDAKGLVRTISNVTTTADDRVRRFGDFKSWFYSRNNVEGENNRKTRDIFKEAILQACGVEELTKLDPSILAVLKAKDFATGTCPLSARRIRAISAAVINHINNNNCTQIVFTKEGKATFSPGSGCPDKLAAKISEAYNCDPLYLAKVTDLRNKLGKDYNLTKEDLDQITSKLKKYAFVTDDNRSSEALTTKREMKQLLDRICNERGIESKLDDVIREIDSSSADIRKCCSSASQTDEYSKEVQNLNELLYKKQNDNRQGMDKDLRLLVLQKTCNFLSNQLRPFNKISKYIDRYDNLIQELEELSPKGGPKINRKNYPEFFKAIDLIVFNYKIKDLAYDILFRYNNKIKSDKDFRVDPMTKVVGEEDAIAALRHVLTLNLNNDRDYVPDIYDLKNDLRDTDNYKDDNNKAVDVLALASSRLVTVTKRRPTEADKREAEEHEKRKKEHELEQARAMNKIENGEEEQLQEDQPLQEVQDNQ